MSDDLTLMRALAELDARARRRFDGFKQLWTVADAQAVSVVVQALRTLPGLDEQEPPAGSPTSPASSKLDRC